VQAISKAADALLEGQGDAGLGNSSGASKRTLHRLDCDELPI
jgi:hypothetical protein